MNRIRTPGRRHFAFAVMALSDRVVTTDEARVTIKEIDEAMAALATLRGVVLTASA